VAKTMARAGSGVKKTKNYFTFVIPKSKVMKNQLIIYNTLSKEKKLFNPIHSPYVGMYVCGPTVYGDPHLGHARPAITFDLLFRYLPHLKYKVRYVRNITDVGHLENDADEGEDKIEKKARLEEKEPMEIAQFYINRYHTHMNQLGVLPPTIEPLASGHILEQGKLVSTLIKKGFAYKTESGAVYFNLKEYQKKYKLYGRLSGRNLDDLYSNTRVLQGQDEKLNAFDFALWKIADSNHLMKWNPYPFRYGYPGWHLECTAMSTKYLGKKFDIHGGGIDLLFPHHECEMAQSFAAFGEDSVNYWMHNNLITINGQKMGKSLGNFITLEQLFKGTHPLLNKSYSPMTIRFFILQSHYRSLVDFSNESLLAAESSLSKILKAIEILGKIKPSNISTLDINSLNNKCYEALNDDLNTPILLSCLYEGVKYINSVNEGLDKLTATDIDSLKLLMNTFVFEILGLENEDNFNNDAPFIKSLIDASINIRNIIKLNKDWNTSDKIREELDKIGIKIKDRKNGTADWEKIRQ
jgi:cysteinyl-tRNA synthetase